MHSPNFIIVGYQDPTGIYLVASKEVRDVQLEHRYHYNEQFISMFEPPMARVDREEIRLSSTLRGYTMVHADSYPQAWDFLFEQWRPPAPRRTELDRRKELPQ